MPWLSWNNSPNLLRNSVMLLRMGLWSWLQCCYLAWRMRRLVRAIRNRRGG